MRREVPKPRQALQQRCQVPTEGRKIFFYQCWRSKEARGGGCRCRRRRCPLSLGVLRVGRGLVPTPGQGKGLEARAQGVQRPQGAVL